MKIIICRAVFVHLIFFTISGNGKTPSVRLCGDKNCKGKLNRIINCCNSTKTSVMNTMKSKV